MGDTPSGSSRPLTRGEIEIARKLFGDSMNYEDVRIQNGKDTPLWKASSYIGELCGAENTCCRAQTVGSTIYMPADQYREDYSKGDGRDRSLFVHEMTHAWQFQNMQMRAGVKTLTDAISLGCYDDVYKYKLDPKKDLGDYNVEQQACIMEELYAYNERRGKPIEPPAPQTPESLEHHWFYATRLKLLTAANKANPNDPTVQQWLKEGSIRFDDQGTAHFTQAFADKKNEENKDYVADRQKADRDLLQVTANFRNDPAYLDQTTDAKILAVAAAVVCPSIVVPVVVVGTAAVKVHEAASIAIDTYGIWAQTDAMVDSMTAPRKFMSTDTPRLANYVQCLTSSARFSHHMRAGAMQGTVEKNSCGRITNLKDIDFSIPANRAEFNRMLDIEIANQKKIIDDNSSIWPRWIRSGDSVMKEASAQADLKMLEGAKRELGMYDREVAAYNRDKAAFDAVFALHKGAAETLAKNLAERQDAATVRSAVTQFLHDENRVREKALELPDTARRQQLLRECDINAASGHYSLASAAETPHLAMAAMQQAREFMQKAGLDPAKEESYKAFGTTKEEFERRAEAYRQQAAEPAKAATCPGQKGYLSGQFANIDSAPAVLAPAAAVQQQRIAATATR